MQKRFLFIITTCLVLTGCSTSDLKDTVNFVIPVELIEDYAKNAKYKMSGECNDLCSETWWKTASKSDVQTQLNASVAVMGRNKYGRTPLHYASQYGTPKHLKLLVGAGADVNARDKYGLRPIHEAAMVAVPNVQTLIESGADVNATDNSGDSSLFFAVTSDIVKLLISAGADIKKRNDSGATPLHSVVRTSTVGGILSLIEAGAEVNAQTSWSYFRETPLHYVSETSETDVGTRLKILLDAGANINAKNVCGFTILHKVSMESRHPELIFLLLKSGAKINSKVEKSPIYCVGSMKLKTPLEFASENKYLKGTKAFYALRDATYK